MKIVIAGASGFIGTELVAQLLAAGHTVIRLVRRAPQSADERSWDPASGQLDSTIMDEADAVVNLSGASLTRLPWTRPYKRIILQSRLAATSTLTDAIIRSRNPPEVFVSGSAVGFYGDRPGEILSERSAMGTGFLGQVVDAWEHAAAPANAVSRVVNPRTGVVIGNSGALKPLMLLTRLGLAGPLGDGTQYWPWISLHDEAAAIVHLVTASSLRGAVNLSGPNPTTSGDITRMLATELGRPYWLSAPKWAIRAALATAGTELLLADQNVSSELLSADGFQFRHPTAIQAIRATLSQ